MALLPRASLSVGSFGGFRLTAGVGKGARSIDPSYITQDVATPFASVLAFEGGVEYAGGSDTIAVAARSTLFQTRVDRDLIFSQTAGRNLLGGSTSRTGWVGSVRVTGEHFDVNANATLVKSIFEDTGLLVPYAPDAVIRADAAWLRRAPAGRSWASASEARSGVGSPSSVTGRCLLASGAT
jgi:iron complex outermembrane receptor protein